MADRVGPLGFIQAMLAEGRTSTGALQAYRDAGGAIRTQRWYRAWGEMSAELSHREQLQSAQVNQPPRAEDITKVTSSRPGAYLYRGGVMVVERDTELIYTLPASVRSQRLVNISDALSQMTGQIESSGSPPGLTVIGSFLTGVRELVPDDLSLAEESDV